MSRLNYLLTAAAIIVFAASATAQTFTERLQTAKAGQGNVTVHHDASIDQLVNNAKLGRPSTQGSVGFSPRTSARPTEGNVGFSSRTSARPTSQDQTQPKTDPAQHKPDTQSPRPAKPQTKTEKPQSDPAERDYTAPVDTRKKVMIGARKVSGYRVQVYAGGNSHAAKQKAEQTAADVKAFFPAEPVYVHFYSPRWICRVGNYRTYEEAHQMLAAVRKLGYGQATIVKGKISVQD